VFYGCCCCCWYCDCCGCCDVVKKPHKLVPIVERRKIKGKEKKFQFSRNHFFVDDVGSGANNFVTSRSDPYFAFLTFSLSLSLSSLSLSTQLLFFCLFSFFVYSILFTLYVFFSFFVYSISFLLFFLCLLYYIFSFLFWFFVYLLQNFSFFIHYITFFYVYLPVSCLLCILTIFCWSVYYTYLLYAYPCVPT
jgi:hypothetical protein